MIEVEEYNGYYLLKFYPKDQKYNLFNIDFMTQFIDILHNLSYDKTRKFLILRGEDNFGAGADLKELLRATTSNEFALTFFNYMREIYHLLMDINKIVISQVKKIAYGASLEILLLSDYVIAETNTKFATPAVRLGLFPPVLSSIGSFIIGYNNVKRLIYRGDVLDADEAKSIGLVNVVTNDIEKETDEILREFGKVSISAILLAKRNMLRPFKQYIDKAFEELILQVATEEAREGILSYINKTNPPWLIDFSKS